MPHMHLLGRDMRLIATTPEGEVHDLIWIQDWDFNWQDAYHYREPLFLPAGDACEARRAFRQFNREPSKPTRPADPCRLGRKNDR